MIVGAELNITPAFGWMTAPEFVTIVTTQRNGIESRLGKNALVRHRFVLPFQNITSDSFLRDLKGVFLVARGQLHSFLAKDHSDFQVEDEVFGLGDGVATQFQLTKISEFGSQNYIREIHKPAAGVAVKVNGSPASATVDLLTGVVTFASPPPADAVLTWSGEFRVLVRFASDALPMSIDNRFGKDGPFAMNGSVELVEVFE